MTDKKPPHRPKGSTIPIDWGQVDKMCAIQCTGEEIAGFKGFFKTSQKKSLTIT